MGVNDICNYLLFDNPVSKGVSNVTKSCLGALGNQSKFNPPAPGNMTIVTKTEAPPLWVQAAQTGPFVRIAGVLGASAVALAAYGAHKSYPKDRADELRKIFESGNRIHMIHSVAMLGVPLCKYPKISGTLFFVGTVFFSGPCYYHGSTGENKFAIFAPIGGSLLVLGWLAMIL